MRNHLIILILGLLLSSSALCSNDSQEIELDFGVIHYPEGIKFLVNYTSHLLNSDTVDKKGHLESLKKVANIEAHKFRPLKGVKFSKMGYHLEIADFGFQIKPMIESVDFNIIHLENPSIPRDHLATHPRHSSYLASTEVTFSFQKNVQLIIPEMAISVTQIEPTKKLDGLIQETAPTKPETQKEKKSWQQILKTIVLSATVGIVPATMETLKLAKTGGKILIKSAIKDLKNRLPGEYKFQQITADIKNGTDSNQKSVENKFVFDIWITANGKTIIYVNQDLSYTNLDEVYLDLKSVKFGKFSKVSSNSGSMLWRNLIQDKDLFKMVKFIVQEGVEAFAPKIAGISADSRTGIMSRVFKLDSVKGTVNTVMQKIVGPLLTSLSNQYYAQQTTRNFTLPKVPYMFYPEGQNHLFFQMHPPMSDNGSLIVGGLFNHQLNKAKGESIDFSQQIGVPAKNDHFSLFVRVETLNQLMQRIDFETMINKAMQAGSPDKANKISIHVLQPPKITDTQMENSIEMKFQATMKVAVFEDALDMVDAQFDNFIRAVKGKPMVQDGKNDFLILLGSPVSIARESAAGLLGTAHKITNLVKNILMISKKRILKLVGKENIYEIPISLDIAIKLQNLVVNVQDFPSGHRIDLSIIKPEVAPEDLPPTIKKNELFEQKNCAVRITAKGKDGTIAARLFKNQKLKRSVIAAIGTQLCTYLTGYTVPLPGPKLLEMHGNQIEFTGKGYLAIAGRYNQLHLKQTFGAKIEAAAKGLIDTSMEKLKSYYDTK